MTEIEIEKCLKAWKVSFVAKYQRQPTVDEAFRAGWNQTGRYSLENEFWK